jgi:uncharacterized membrane protein
MEMGKFLENLHRALLLGLFLMLVLVVLLHRSSVAEPAWAAYFLMYVHVFFGILWIGLLYYFNFVQIPTMPKIPAELKPAVSKHIAPAALFWFRWAAAFTVLFGLVTAGIKDDIALTLEVRPPYTTIGIGMWLAIIMAANVWFIIWPNQKKALGIVAVDDASKAKAARVAMIASRTNTVLSIPMLYCMVMQGAALNIG